MKKLLIIGLVGVLLASITGCAALETPKTETDDKTVSISNIEETDQNLDDTSTENEYYVSPTDHIEVGDTITIGDIMTFDGDYIHIISGDLVEVFKYDNTSSDKFYLGQTVQLIKGEQNNHLQVFEKENYSIQHTNMGHPIDQITGKVTTIDTETLIIKNVDGTFAIKTYNSVHAEIGDQVTVYTMTFDTTLSAVMVLNEASKLSLEVIEITRSEEGYMNVLAKDADGGEYALNLSAASLELDMSTVIVGDTLTVYHQGIMESWPMQLDTILIRK